MICIEDIVRKYTSLHLPRIVLQPLIRLLHEREVNALLAGGAHLSPREFLRYIFYELDVRSHVNFTSALPSDGRYLFVANHPFGALDGMLLADMLLDRWTNVGVVVNEVLMYIEPLRPLWIPVRKYSGQRAEEVSIYGSAMASAKQILSFPAGLCSRWDGRRVRDAEWHSRFVRDAERCGRQIVPVFVEGRLSMRFYNIYRLRRALRFPLNIEQLLLVDELFAQRGREVRIVVGAPLDVGALRGSVVDKSRYVRERVYALQ